MKKLLVTSTDLMMIQFLITHVSFLTENGYEVDIACSDVGSRIMDVKNKINGKIKLHTIDLVRNPMRIQNSRGYRQLKDLINNNQYDLIWTNEPVMGVLTRLAAKNARKSRAKVVYIAHGFHFYKGAPWINWIFYPIEKYMSRLTDVLVTINHEDEKRAKEEFHCQDVRYIPGIGIDTLKYKVEIDIELKRKELGISPDNILIVSVGELQHRKNHEPIIRAIAKLNNKSIKYVICGVGNLHKKLLYVAKKLGIEDQLLLVGYRNDINEILHAADIFAFPSRREGLGLAALEAMAAGLPLVTSNVQGIPDYLEHGVNGYKYNSNDIKGYAEGLNILIHNPVLRKKIGMKNMESVEGFDIYIVKNKIEKIITSLLY